MLSLTPAHEAGVTLTSMGATLALTGGADGVISLYTRRSLAAAPSASRKQGGPPPTAVPLWARHCHDGAVTAVWLEESLDLGVSCGRDGKVVLHEDVQSGTRAPPASQPPTAATANPGPAARVICRVTGELRCLWLDPARQRLFIGGDSLRCLCMHRKPFTVVNIPYLVPRPLLAISCNPSGDLLAMASAETNQPGGAVAVVSVHPQYLEYCRRQQQQQQQLTQQTASESQAASQPPVADTPEEADSRAFLEAHPHFIAAHRAVAFRLPAHLARAAVQAEATTFRLSWVALPPTHLRKEAPRERSPAVDKPASGMSLLEAPQLLLLPSASEVQVFRFDPAAIAPYAGHRMHLVGHLHGASALEGMETLPQDGRYYFTAVSYPLSPRRLVCVVGTPAGVSALRVETGKLSTTITASQSYMELDRVTVSLEDHSVDVCPVTGDVLVGLTDGRVSLLKQLAVKAGSGPGSGAASSSASQKLVEKKKGEGSSGEPTPALPAAVPTSTRRSTPASARVDPEEDEALLLGGAAESGTRDESERHRSLRHEKRSVRDRNEEGDVHNEKSFMNDSEDDSQSVSSASDSSSSSTSGSSSATGEEHLGDVVRDLQRVAGRALADGEVGMPRASRWRRSDKRAALREAERELLAHPTATSIYLDDEAEEASSEELREELREAGRELYLDDDNAMEEQEEYDDDVDERGLRAAEGRDDDGVSSEGDLLRDGHRRASPGRCGGGGGGMQPYAFQLGATPYVPVDDTPTTLEPQPPGAGSCYLAYNGVGYVHYCAGSIVIHFHNVAIPAVRIPEHRTVLMGTLGPVGAGFAVLADDNLQAGAGPEEAEEHSGPAALGGGDGEDPDMHLNVDSGTGTAEPRVQVCYRTFTSVGAESSWTLRLPAGEGVRAMAAGVNYLAVATTRYLRVYSTSGLELAVLSKFPHIVTLLGMNSQRLYQNTVLAARGLEAGSAPIPSSLHMDPLVVVYMEPSGAHMFEILDISSRTSILAPQCLSLTPLEPKKSRGPADNGYYSHQLQWIGWSDDGPLHTVDTAGVIRLYTKSWGGSWVPVYDPRVADVSRGGRRGAGRTYLWVWGAADDRLFAYRCSEALQYPVALAGGLPVENVPLFLPLARHPLSDQQSATWEQLLRRQIRTDELKQRSEFYTATIANRDAFHDRKLLDLFDHALSNLDARRAVDLADRLELRDNIEACARKANSGRHTQLVRALLRLLEERVKSKRKRRCALPLEGSAVSDKERDRLLRRLLAREKQELSSSAPANPPERRADGLSATLNNQRETSTVTEVQRVDVDVSQKEVEAVMPNSDEMSRTNTTSANQATPADAPIPPKHVTFSTENLVVAGAAPPRPLTSNAPSADAVANATADGRQEEAPPLTPQQGEKTRSATAMRRRRSLLAAGAGLPTPPAPVAGPPSSAAVAETPRTTPAHPFSTVQTSETHNSRRTIVPVGPKKPSNPFAHPAASPVAHPVVRLDSGTAGTITSAPAPAKRTTAVLHPTPAPSHRTAAIGTEKVAHPTARSPTFSISSTDSPVAPALLSHTSAERQPEHMDEWTPPRTRASTCTSTRGNERAGEDGEEDAEEEEGRGSILGAQPGSSDPRKPTAADTGTSLSRPSLLPPTNGKGAAEVPAPVMVRDPFLERSHTGSSTSYSSPVEDDEGRGLAVADPAAILALRHAKEALEAEEEGRGRALSARLLLGGDHESASATPHTATLASVGHDEEKGPVGGEVGSRSSAMSVAASLRKRLREEDEEDDGDVLQPAAALPRISF
eukprot:gene12300-8441_t